LTLQLIFAADVQLGEGGESLAQTQTNCMLGSILKIRENPVYMSSLILVIVEANYGITHSNLKQEVRDAGFENVEFMVERSGPVTKNTVGVIKGPNHAEKYLHLLDTMLKHDYLAIADNFTVLDPPYGGEPEDMITTLGFMMLNLHPDEKNHNKPTAKTNDLSDDPLIAFQMNLFWPQMFWRNPMYSQLTEPIRKNGLYRFTFPGLLFEQT
jgi:hypothetical protein